MNKIFVQVPKHLACAFCFSEKNSGRKGFGRLGGQGCVKCWPVHNSDHELQGNDELLTCKIPALVLANGYL